VPQHATADAGVRLDADPRGVRPAQVQGHRVGVQRRTRRRVDQQRGVVTRRQRELGPALLQPLQRGRRWYLVKSERGQLGRPRARRGKRAADDVGWMNRNLYAGLVPHYGSSAITLVGTPADLARAFMEYKEIGVTQFIIAGWPKLDEMMIFGREVLPLVRELEGTFHAKTQRRKEEF